VPLQSFLEVLPATVMQARVEDNGGAPLKKKKGKGGKFDEAAFLKELQESAVEYSTDPVLNGETRVKRQFLIFSATLVHVDYTRLFKSGAKGTFARGDGIAMTDEESKTSSFERCPVRWLLRLFLHYLHSFADAQIDRGTEATRPPARVRLH
jgi:hypothetical protein